MNETAWMIVIGLVILAIVVASFLLRGKHDAEDATGTHAPPPPASPAAPTPPQTIAAEDTPPAPAVVEVEGDIEPDAPASLIPPVAPESTPNTAEGDNLLKLKGVGPKIATLLRAEGVTRYAQIAGWSDADIAAIDAKLGSFAGRPARDNWVDQARLLAAGDTAGYEAKYGKL